MKSIFSINLLSRILFLLLTPVLFQYFALGFIWHSIYWGVITMVVIIWFGFILLSPIIGRIGCGWFCFMGTVNDLSGAVSPFKRKWKKPKSWQRLILVIFFFASAFFAYFLNVPKGITHNFKILPSYLNLSFDFHYKIVWVADISFAFILGFLLNKRWGCKNLCIMGSLCTIGASYSRLIPVVNFEKCTFCEKCENECLSGIPIVEYVKNNQGLVTNSECILCGKCVSVCKKEAIQLKFVWNRNKFKNAS